MQQTHTLQPSKPSEGAQVLPVGSANTPATLSTTHETVDQTTTRAESIREPESSSSFMSLAPTPAISVTPPPKSDATSHVSVGAPVKTIAESAADAPAPARPIKEPPVTTSSVGKSSELDLCKRLPDCHRLLELYQEQGSGGLGGCIAPPSLLPRCRILIDQSSTIALANKLNPGNARGIDQIDFAKLDSVQLNIIGAYGDRGILVEFLKVKAGISQEL